MPIKVLLVDDDEAFRSVTAIALVSRGYVVSEAADGGAALELLRRDRPDVIISDLNMPGLDGRALCQSVRADPYLAGIPFVILSALIERDATGDPAELRPELRADCCLSKQTPFWQILRRIEALATRLS
jgi:CheY-like chemotaxis protein